MKDANVKSQLRNLRQKNSLTQQDMADRVGVSRQTVVAIEGGNYTPSVLLAIKLARSLDCTVEDLFTLQ